MPAVVTLGEVQAWLEQTKLTLSALPAEMEASQQAHVFGYLSRVYDTSLWLSPTTTPTLIRKLVAMRVAGWTYNRQFSQEAATMGDSYGNLLLRSADMLLDQIVEGHIGIPEEEAILLSRTVPQFYRSEPIFSLDGRY